MRHKPRFLRLVGLPPDRHGPPLTAGGQWDAMDPRPQYLYDSIRNLDPLPPARRGARGQRMVESVDPDNPVVVPHDVDLRFRLWRYDESLAGRAAVAQTFFDLAMGGRPDTDAQRDL